MAKLNPKKKYALIQNKQIHSIFLGAELPEYNEKDLEIVEAKETWNLGDSYENGKVTSGAASKDAIQKTREKKLMELEMARGTHMFEKPAMFRGHEFQMTPQSYERLTATASLAALTGEVPSGFFWISSDNKRVEMTYEDFKQFSKIFVARYFDSFKRHQDLREKLERAKSISEISLVTW